MVTISSKKRYGCKERERLFNTTLSKAFIAVLHFTVTDSLHINCLDHDSPRLIYLRDTNNIEQL